MEYKKLGNTPFTVSHICFGALTIGPLGAYLKYDEGAKIIRLALEKGVNFIDTAEYYRTYPYIKKALENWHKEVVIASKTYAETKEDVLYAVEEALRELGRERIEIFLLHEQRSAEAVRKHMPLLEFLHDLKAQGKIGAVGISTHNVGAAAIAAEIPEIEVLHPLINQAGIGINGGSRDEMISAIQKNYDAGKGIYGMKSMGGGSLMNKAKDMQKWSLTREYLHSVAIGMKDIAEVATNIGWYEGIEPAEAKEVKHIIRNLIFDDCIACGKCIAACHQNALLLQDNKAVWDRSKCVYCGYCIPACPGFFISFA